ncbi:hypothetical protein FY034_06775 [Trichlorobacter lovleyi]|uniref:DUF6538 domain-containing protein n=1 Tax=Trichlorobacter lovleyi TaxID=313985 RepID=UPI0022407A58|nr:DUF6538 domain-containing protein [Trichlorobacter lovleyi]QOX78638.1 hypothetical protein FY034_06775 [Trichlorobacter lovleyi]
MTGLVKRGKNYSLIVSVPLDVQAFVGKKQIWKSLKSTKYDHARIYARHFHAWIEGLFLLVRSRMITPEQIEGLVAEYGLQSLSIWQYFEQIPHDPSRRPTPAKIKESSEAFSNAVAEYQLKLATDDLDELDETADRLLTNSGTKPTAKIKKSAEYRQLKRGLVQADVDYCKIISERVRGEYDSDYQRRKISEWQSQKPKPKGVLLKTLLQVYVDDWIKTAKHEGRVHKKQSTYKTLYKNIYDCFKDDVYAASIGDEEIEKLKSYFAASKLKPATVNKKLEDLSSAYNWAMSNAAYKKNIICNPFKGLRLSVGRQRDRRDIFEDEQLQTYVNALAETYDTNHPEMLWIPIICMHSGMRPNEIAQLYTDDIILVRDRWFFEARNNKERKQSVKTDKGEAGVERRVPIHQNLIDLGLLEYIGKQSAESQVFPNCKYSIKDGYYSGSLSVALNQIIHEHVSSNKKLVLYSLRAQFRTTLEMIYTEMAIAGNHFGLSVFVDRSIDDIMGHVIKGGKGETVYRKQRDIICSEVVSRLKYDVDFSKLKHVLGVI